MVGNNFEILFEADDGHDMQCKLKKNNLPDIILMDIHMPGMDGFSSVEWLRKHFPQIKILVELGSWNRRYPALAFVAPSPKSGRQR